MIEPVRSGAALVEEVRATRPAEGAVAVWWLGQSGFVLKSADTLLVVDPYLSEHLTAKYADTARPHVRMTRAPLGGGDLTDVDLVLCSHKHSDHFDPGTVPDLLAASPRARLGLPASLVEHAVGLGLEPERLVGLTAGETWSHAGAEVRAIPSAHETLDVDETGRHLYLGFVITLAGLRFYHSGDTLAYDGLAEAVGGERVDALFLPINGRDPARGVPGNMNSAEAVALANRVAPAPRFVVPHHYDMFTFNTAPVSEFVAATRALGRGAAPKVLRCGERWEVSR